MKIVILDSETVTKNDVLLDEITDLAESKVFGYTINDEVAERIADADIVICNKCLITEEVFEKCANLKYVGLFATGYNNVDLEAANKHGAIVCNVPSYSTNSVAQHTFAMILNYYSKISEYVKSVQDGDWVNYKYFSCFGLPTAELAGKTIGIIGYGDIGRKTAQIANAFDMKVLAFSRTKSKIDEYAEYSDLENLLKISDVVSLHCPLTNETEKLINGDTLSLMKSDSLLVNTARGGLVDEVALAEALNNGEIGGACIDVLTFEPMREDCPLRFAKNCMITPHVAWSPKETRERLVKVVAENVKGFITGNPQNVVNR